MPDNFNTNGLRPIAGIPPIKPVDNTNSINLTEFKKVYTEIQAKQSKYPSYSPIGEVLGNYIDDVNSFKPFSKNTSTPFIGGNPLSYETRALNQSGGWLFGHSVAQFFLGEMVGGTVSGFGTLARPDKWVERVAGTDDAFQKTLVEEFGEWIQESTRNAFPIYKTQKAEKGVALGDATWYASMAPTVASAISILLPARAAAFLPAYIAKTLTASNAFTKAARTATKAEEFAKISRITKAEHWTTIASAALAGRVIDSTRESLGRYDEYYQEFLAKGMSKTEARKEASEAAAKGFRMSHANIVFDLVEWGTILKMGNYMNKSYVNSVRKLLMKYDKAGVVLGKGGAEVAAKAIRAEIAMDMLKTGFVEGFDEMTMDIFQEEGKYQYDVQHGLTKETTFDERLGKHLADRKSWDSFIGGMVGGLFFMLPYGSVIEKVTNKKGIERQKEFVNNIIQNAEANKKIIEQMDEAIMNNNSKLATTLKDQLLINIASKSFANGTIEYDKAMLKNMATKTPEQLKEDGINSNIGAYLNDIIESVDTISKIYENEIDNIRLRDDKGEVHSSNFAINMAIAESKAKIAMYEKRRDQFAETTEYQTVKKDLNELESSLTDVGKAYFETLLNYAENDEAFKNRIQAIEDGIKEIERQITVERETTLSNQTALSKYMAESSIKAKEEAIKHLKEQIKLANDKKTEAEAKRKVSLQAFDGVDTEGNPVLSQDIKDRINSRLNDIKNQAGTQATLNKYDELDRVLEIEKAVLETKSSKEGIEMMKEFHYQSQKDYIEKQKQQIEDDLKGLTLSELNDKKNKYSKQTAVPSEIWSPIIESKIKEAKRKSKVTNQNTANSNINSQNKPQASASQNTSVNSSPIVQGTPTQVSSKLSGTPTVTITSPGRASSKELFDLQNKIIAEVKASIKYPENFTEEEKAEQLANIINNQLHTVQLLNMFLNKDIIVKLVEENKKLASMSISQLYDFLKVKDITDLMDGETAFERLFVDIVGLASLLGQSKSQVMVNSNGTYSFVGPPNDVYATDLIDHINAIDPTILDIMGEDLKSYMDQATKRNESYSELFERIRAEIPDDEYENTAKRTSAIVINNLINSIEKAFTDTKSDYSIFSINDSNRLVIKELIRYIYKATGRNSIPRIDENQVFRFLRDRDQLGNYRWVFYTLDIYTKFLKHRIRELKEIDAQHIATVTEANAEIESLTKQLNLFAFKDEINDETINDARLKSFIRLYGADVELRATEKTGVTTILNLKDSKGEDLFISEESVISQDDSGIYNNINGIVEGAEVIFEQDFSDNTLDKYTVPVKINLASSNNQSTPTILFLRDMLYESAGIQYGRKTKDGYRFFGINEVLNDSNYYLLESNFDSLRKLYYHYRQSGYDNLSNADKEKHSREANKIFKSLYANNNIKELLLKIVNQNLETTDKRDEVYIETMISLLDAVFFQIKTEQLEDKTDTASILHFGANVIKSKITNRDKRYEKDFELTKALRDAIDNGTLKESKITYVSIPTVLSIQEDHYSDEVRNTLDDVIKPILVEGEETPRIVLIQQDRSGKYIDLKTGKEFKDKRFNSEHYYDKFSILGNLSSSIRVLVQAPNGTIIPYGTQVNVLGRSFTNEQDRAAATKVVADVLYNTLCHPDITSLNNTIMSESLKGLSDLVINDSNSKNKKDYEMALSRYSDNTMARLTILTLRGNQKVYVNIVRNFATNTISFYSSDYYNDIIIDEKNLGKHISNKYTSQEDMDLSVSDDFVEIYDRLESIAGKMLRQPAIEYGKTSTDVPLMFRHNLQTLENGKLYDKLTDAIYEDAQDYYIKTGALFTYAGFVKNEKGEVITNFNLKGRYPFTVNISHTDKEFEAYTTDSLKGIVGKNKLISETDPMLDLIGLLDDEIGSSIYEINVLDKRNPSNYDSIAGIKEGTDTNKGKFRINVYLPYQSQKRIGDLFQHASSNIAHEYIHGYINKRYSTPSNETDEEKKERIANIAYHNKVMSQYITDLKTHWESIDSETKLSIVKSSLNTEIDIAKQYVQYFDSFIRQISEDARRKNDKFNNDLNSGNTIDYNHSIQEVISYSYSNPFVSLILNGLDTNTDYKRNDKKSFWDLLIDKLFSILSRLFNVSFKLNNRSQLAKLHSLVNQIFDRRIRDARENDFEENVPKTDPFETKETTEESKDDSNIPDDLGGGEWDMNIDEDYEEQQSQIFNINTNSEGLLDIDLSSIARVVSNPEETIRDAENLPIC